ncbi:sensor histidine kinase [Nonomuraea sp. NPDC049419]|uniref:sensor histidine kinase n=1 Tax=Nonomuraea sp. NPDC049419 TaxID=3155772 RepID=UPI003444D6FD
MKWGGQRLDGWIVTDVVTAIVVALIIRYAVADPPGPSSCWPTWAAWLIGAVLALPIAVRRRRSRAVLAFAAVTGVLATVTGAVAAGAIWVTYVPTALVLYLVASATPLAWSAASLAACVAGAVTAVLIFYEQVFPGLEPAAGPSELPAAWPIEIGAISVLLITAGAVGAAVRWKRETTARLVRHLSEAVVADERRRIARELHDVIGHSMSLIAVKATVANHVADARPQEARAALAIIEQTSRSTLTEIHRVLGLLRSDGDARLTQEETHLPVPGVADLPGLADHARSAGVGVELTVHEEAALPPAVAMSIYRIVQQALTNVITHAAPTHCSVTVHINPRETTIEVLDDGPRLGRPPRTGHGGHGLIGMRERVKLYGGTFSAGPRPEGGFRVAARLPYDENSNAT